MEILVAEHQPKVRFALRVLLERHPRARIVGEAASMGELLCRLADGCPHLILLAWDLPGLDLDALATIRRACPGMRVVAMSGRSEAQHAALEAGVDAFEQGRAA